MFLKADEKLENPDFEGTQSRLYIKGDYLYKIYFGKKCSSILHLEKLINMQKEIKLTTFPDNILYKCEEDNVNFIGCRIQYFKNYITLNRLNKLNYPLDKKLDILIQIINSLDELLKHNIYPRDLDAENILVGDNIKLIDLDTIDTEITTSPIKEKYKLVLKLYRIILLKTIYPEFKKLNRNDYIIEFLKNNKIKESLISDIVDDNFDFKDAKNLIYYLKDRV